MAAGGRRKAVNPIGRGVRRPATDRGDGLGHRPAGFSPAWAAGRVPSSPGCCRV